jgi:hypothetical protein
MPEYRTPREEQVQYAHQLRVKAVLDQAVSDATSCRLAIRMGEPPEVVERWVDAIWDGLRDGLSDTRQPAEGITQEDRLLAIVMFIGHKADDEALRILDAMEAVGDA